MLLTNRSRMHHFTCDVTGTSFYMGLKPNLTQHPPYWCPGMYVSSFVLLLLRVAEILRGKMGAKICPPAAGGWRGGTAAAGLNYSCSYYLRCMYLHLYPYCFIYCSTCIKWVQPGTKLFFFTYKLFFLQKVIHRKCPPQRRSHNCNAK